MRNVGGLAAAAVAGGLLFAGCGTAHQAHNVAAPPATSSPPAPVRTVATAPPATPSAPAPVPTKVATAPAAAPSVVATAALTGDQKACHAIETHALPHTQQQVDDYMSFLSGELLVASSPALRNAIADMNAGILGVMAGTVSEAQENARGAKVDALCAKVGQQ